MLLQSDYPPDIRLAKEIKSLTGAGYVVFLLANNATQKPVKEQANNGIIYRMPRFKRLPDMLGKILRLPVPFNFLWYLKIFKIVRRHKIQVIHAHDLPMAPFGLLTAKIFNIRFVYDMHENYPAAMAEWNRHAGIIQKVTRNEKVALLLDLFCAKRAHRIIVVVKEMFDLLRRRKIASEKIYIVSNTVDVEAFEFAVFDEMIIRKYKNSYIILYLGAFSVERGLETAIKAMHEIVEKIPNARLLLVGDGKNRSELETLVKKERAEHLVEFTGWVDFKKAPSFIYSSEICIIPQPAGPFINTTIPHKLFQYMAMGKPVLTSDAKPLKRIVEECQCGEYFRSNDEHSFARTVVKMFRSDKNYAENGRRAVRNKYNWPATARTLIRLYESL